MSDALTLVQGALFLFVHLLIAWWVIDVLVRALFRKVDTKAGFAALPRDPQADATGAAPVRRE